MKREDMLKLKVGDRVVDVIHGYRGVVSVIDRHRTGLVTLFTRWDGGGLGIFFPHYGNSRLARELAVAELRPEVVVQSKAGAA